MYNETNTFWEIKLAESPESVSVYAREKAEEYIRNAETALQSIQDTDEKAIEYLKNLLGEAVENFHAGKKYMEVGRVAGKASIYDWSRATRAYTKAQVKALMVCNIITPPPSKPADFGV